MKARGRERPATFPEVDAPPLPGDAASCDREHDEAALAEWRDWMSSFGRRVRRAREALGLTQQQLGACAGVSPRVIGRLEAGLGLATPLLIVLKLQQGLATRLRAHAPAGLDDALHTSLDLDLLAPLVGDVPVAADAATEELALLYHGTPARLRARLLSIVRVAADGLRSES